MGSRERFLEHVEDALDRRWFTNNGPYVQGVERRVREYCFLGTNRKMSEISAAMGLTGLESLDDVIEINRVNHERYRLRLNVLPGVAVMQPVAGERANYHYTVVDVDPLKAGLTRDQLVTALVHENVFARRDFYPGVHELESYRSYQPMAHWVLPETQQLCQRIMILPTGQAVDRVIEVIVTALQEREAVIDACSRMDCEKAPRG